MLARGWRWTQTILPLIGLGALLWVLWAGLFLNPRELPSPLLYSKIPEGVFLDKKFKQEPGIIHFFSNEEEKEIIQKITQKWPVPFYGVSYKGGASQKEDSVYQWVIRDGGKIGIELGVCSTPEFYIIDPKHHIYYKHTGPLSEKIFTSTFMPILAELSWIKNKPSPSKAPFFTSNQREQAIDALKIYERLIKELRCVTCQNQSLADSTAPIAVSMREFIYTKLHEGATEAEIKDFLVSRYGNYVLYSPPVKKETWLLWLGPFLFLLIGMGVGIRLLNQDSVKHKER